MATLSWLLFQAHENSALRRRYPTGCTADDLPNFTVDRTDDDAQVNTGFPDDWIEATPETTKAPARAGAHSRQ